jgi:hypothetical protein
MGFSIDTSLVQRVLQDTSLQVVYRLPEQWQDMTTDAGIDKALEEDSSRRIRLVRLAGDTAAKVMLSLVDITALPDTTYRQLKNNYRQILNGNGQWEKVELSEFTKDGFRVHQYVMTKAGQVNFKLIFFRQDQPFTQLDFQVPANGAFAAHTKIFESIIGSFKNYP